MKGNAFPGLPNLHRRGGRYRYYEVLHKVNVDATPFAVNLVLGEPAHAKRSFTTRGARDLAIRLLEVANDADDQWTIWAKKNPDDAKIIAPKLGR